MPAAAAFTAGMLNAQVMVTKTTAADTLTISTGGLTVTTNSFEVVPGASNHLTVSAIVSPQTAGTPFGINVAAYDAHNNPASGGGLTKGSIEL